MQARTGPEGSRRLRLPRIQDNRHMKVVRLSAPRTGRLYPPGNIPGNHFCSRLSRSQGHSAAGRFVSKKNSNDTLGNRTCAVPNPAAPPLAPCARKKKPLFNTFNAELNPTCHLLALLGTHHILHVSRIRFNVTLFITNATWAYLECQQGFQPDKWVNS